MINNLNKSRSEQILSLYGIDQNDLKKSGEGSHGGVVIGHTSTGKPVYKEHDHQSYSDFTSQDHVEAAKVHGIKEKETGDYEHRTARFHHLKEALK